MQHFGTAEVARLTGIPARVIRGMVRSRYVAPDRGARGALHFSFQDLVLLRTARALLAARTPSRRIGAALRALRARLPADDAARPLTVTAEGDRIVVHEAGGRRDAHSGQLLLSLEVQAGGAVEWIAGTTAPPRSQPDNGDCERQFEAALALEQTDVDAAVEAYRLCVANHAHRGATANLGRLLHLDGRISEAIAVYREASQPDADILYNLGVALEDLGDSAEAILTYQRVLTLDPDFADAHHNVARLYEQAGDARRALRHWNAWRRLTRG